MTTFARTTTGDLAIPRSIVTDPSECARQQAIDILSLWASEWFLDQSVGFPWSMLLGLKIVNTTQITALLRQALLSVTGVVSVDVDSQFNRVARSFAYTFKAKLDTGKVLTGGTNQPFVVQPIAGQA